MLTIKEFCATEGLTLTEFAALMGVHLSAVSRWAKKGYRIDRSAGLLLAPVRSLPLKGVK